MWSIHRLAVLGQYTLAYSSTPIVASWATHSRCVTLTIYIIRYQWATVTHTHLCAIQRIRIIRTYCLTCWRCVYPVCAYTTLCLTLTSCIVCIVRHSGSTITSQDTFVCVYIPIVACCASCHTLFSDRVCIGQSAWACSNTWVCVIVAVLIGGTIQRSHTQRSCANYCTVEFEWRWATSRNTCAICLIVCVCAIDAIIPTNISLPVFIVDWRASCNTCASMAVRIEWATACTFASFSERVCKCIGSAAALVHTQSLLCISVCVVWAWSLHSVAHTCLYVTPISTITQLHTISISCAVYAKPVPWASLNTWSTSNG